VLYLNKLLIVVDYQNDFVNGSLGFKKALDLEKVISDKILEYKDKGEEVIFTLDTHNDNYLKTLEGRNLPISHCIKGTVGHEIYGKIKGLSKDAIRFEKNTYPSLQLGNYLKDKNYQSVELCGVVTNICVLANAIIVKAALPNALIIIDRNAVASYNDDMHQKALDIMAGLHFQIIN